jgi:hypothetical protein
MQMGTSKQVLPFCCIIWRCRQLQSYRHCGFSKILHNVQNSSYDNKVWAWFQAFAV